MDKKFSRERRRFRIRFFKQVKARRDRTRFLLGILLFTGLLLFLFETGRRRDVLFRVEEFCREFEIEKNRPAGEAPEGERAFPQWTEKYGLTFRFKTGELLFYHEKEGEKEG